MVITVTMGYDVETKNLETSTRSLMSDIFSVGAIGYQHESIRGCLGLTDFGQQADGPGQIGPSKSRPF